VRGGVHRFGWCGSRQLLTGPLLRSCICRASAGLSAEWLWGQVQQGTEEDVSIGGATQRVQPAPIDWSRASRNRWVLFIFRVPWSVIPSAGRFGHGLAARYALSLASPVLSCRGRQRVLRVQPRSGQLSGGAVQGGTLLLAHAPRIQRRKLRDEGWIQHEAGALGAEEARLA